MDDVFPEGKAFPKARYHGGEGENSKAGVGGISFGLSGELAVPRNHFPSPLAVALSRRRLSSPCGRAEPNSTASQFKERSARERETDFERFPGVGEEKRRGEREGELKALGRREPLIRNSLGRDRKRGGAMRLEVFEIVCRANRNINRA